MLKALTAAGFYRTMKHKEDYQNDRTRRVKSVDKPAYAGATSPRFSLGGLSDQTTPAQRRSRRLSADKHLMPVRTLPQEDYQIRLRD